MKLILYCAVIFLACALTCLTGPDSVANAKPIPSDTESGKGSSDSNKDKCSKCSSDSKKDKGSSDSKKDKSSSESDELDRCSTSPCKNSGTCVEVADNYTCRCIDGFKGRNCEELDRCSTSPCKNNGTCVEVADNYTCRCIDGFKGRNCEELDRCSTSPCKNSGTCVEVADNYTCRCIDGFKGRNCEEAVEPCPEEGWTLFSGSCYYVSDTKLDWLSAVAACNETGGYLAEFQSPEEVFFTYTITDLFDTIWIGLNDIQTEDEFVWHYSGDPVSFSPTFYKENQHPSHDCVFVFIYYQYWYDDDCNNQLLYICEKDATYN
ncbi:delta-like protein C isoform X3 [Mercenaria mercenaria]|uniref:delta-like protein C isoform X3 n=1 Tax=Mercenaria mercenaria TaxID=6596 RepID=UPI00234EF46E|nr:delta-like protein C isoform X3 [Mercenaria mercenaria]